MPWGVFLFFLLGGYFFCRFDPRTAYNANRLRRDHLLFQAVGFGLLFGAVSFLVTHYALAPNWPCLAQWWKLHFPGRLSGTAAGTFLIGVTLGFLLRGVCSDWATKRSRWSGFRRACHAIRAFWYDRYLRGLVARQGSKLEQLLVGVGDRGGLVQVTLDNRKVYIGTVYYLPAEYESGDTHLLVNLYASGFRGQHRLSVHVTNRYAILLRELEVRLERLEYLQDLLRQRRNRSWSSQERRTRRLAIVALWYKQVLEDLEMLMSDLTVTIPFDRIVTAMPFDETIFARMDGHDASPSAS